MIGTPKQIEWATQIKADAYKAIDDMIFVASGRVRRGDFPELFQIAVNEFCEAARKNIEGFDAKKTIDNRHLMTRSLIDQGAYHNYKLKAGLKC